MGVLTGAPCWVDLSTPDVEATASFYTSLFAWEVQDPDPVLGYRLCFKNGKLVAGLAQDAEAELPWWTTNIAVKDINAIAHKTLQSGGAITSGPGQFGDYGRWVAATDPAGTKVLMLELHATDGAELRGAPGTWATTDLVADDVHAVAAFYRALFGWELTTTTQSPGAREHTWTLDGTVVAGARTRPADWPGTRPNLWVTTFAVLDVDEAIKTAITLGAQHATRHQDGAALVLDPHGALFALTDAVCLG